MFIFNNLKVENLPARCFVDLFIIQTINWNNINAGFAFIYIHILHYIFKQLHGWSAHSYIFKKLLKILYTFAGVEYWQKFFPFFIFLYIPIYF